MYPYKDHLGNIRLNYAYDKDTDLLKVLDEHHYYPFGLEHGAYNRLRIGIDLPVLDDNTATMRRPAFMEVENSGYQYKYNGKELQDELDLNVYDYGARFYDPSAPRFWQIDPNADNYYDNSPYAYVGNNPILRIDPDGKDWVIGINHKTKTITVSANFTTRSGNTATQTLQKAASNWNSQSGKYNYVVGKGDSAISYTVNFNITVNQSSSNTAENTVTVLSDNSKLFKTRVETDSQVNTIEVKPQGASNGTNFAVKKSQEGNDNVMSHEMGHNLGMNHTSFGIMKKTVGGKKLKKTNVKENLGHSNVGKGRKNSSTNATMTGKTETGTAPSGFQSGKLKKNKNWNGNKF